MICTHNWLLGPVWLHHGLDHLLDPVSQDGPVSVRRRAGVFDAGPSSNRHRLGVFCFQSLQGCTPAAGHKAMLPATVTKDAESCCCSWWWGCMVPLLVDGCAVVLCTDGFLLLLIPLLLMLMMMMLLLLLLHACGAAHLALWRSKDKGMNWFRYCLPLQKSFLSTSLNNKLLFII